MTAIIENKTRVELRLPLAIASQLSSRYVYHSSFINPNLILKGSERRLTATEDDACTPLTTITTYIESSYFTDYWGLLSHLIADMRVVYRLILSEHTGLPLNEIRTTCWDDGTFDTSYGTFSLTYYPIQDAHTFSLNGSKLYLREWD